MFDDYYFHTFQSCIGLNNIQYLRKEIEAIPEFFELSNSDEGSKHLSVVTKTSSKMEVSVLHYMDGVIAKVSYISRFNFLFYNNNSSMFCVVFIY